MRRVFTLTLSIVATPWIFSAPAVTEAIALNEPNAGVLFSPNTSLKSPSTNARLAGVSSSLSDLNTTPSSNPATTPTSSSPFSTNTTDINDSDPSIVHKSSPVAMIGGSLAVFIAILAAGLVICVTRRRKSDKRRRRHVSVIRALEGHLSDPNSLGPQIEDYPRRGTDISSGLSPPSRPSSIRGNFRESGRTAKKKSSFRGSRYTSPHLDISATDDIELDYQPSKTASPHIQERLSSLDRLAHDETRKMHINPSSSSSSRPISTRSSDLAANHGSGTFIFGDRDASAPGHPLPITHARSQDRSRPLSNEGKASFGLSSPGHAVFDERTSAVPLPSDYLSRSPLSSPVHTVLPGDLPPAYEDIR